MIDYHQAETVFWKDKLTIDQIIEFQKKHRVEVLLQADCQYHCFIDYKEGQGSDAIALTFLGALFQGIYQHPDR